MNILQDGLPDRKEEEMMMLMGNRYVFGRFKSFSGNNVGADALNVCRSFTEIKGRRVRYVTWKNGSIFMHHIIVYVEMMECFASSAFFVKNEDDSSSVR